MGKTKRNTRYIIEYIELFFLDINVYLASIHVCMYVKIYI